MTLHEKINFKSHYQRYYPFRVLRPILYAFALQEHKTSMPFFPEMFSKFKGWTKTDLIESKK
jgi:hypothetical protein